MSDEKNTGGPAFPFLYDANNSSDIVPHVGMTLRDYFAAKAMQGLFSYTGKLTRRDARRDYTEGLHVDNVADWAYAYADAMLKARDE